jgi:predicted PurR-regulated permease PerM
VLNGANCADSVPIASQCLAQCQALRPGAATGAVAVRDGRETGRVQSVWDRAKPIYLALLLALLTWVAIQALAELTHVLLIVFVSILFAAALTGPVRWLQRWRIPRAVSVIAIYVLTIALVVGTLWLVTPPLFDQVATLGDRAPEYAERYDEVRATYEDLRESYPSLPSFDAQLERLGNSILARAGDRALDLPSALFALFLDALSVFVISTLLVTNRERILRFTLSLVHPTDRELVGRLLEQMWSRVGSYLRAKVIVMAIVGALTYLALLAIGVPFPLVLALIVALGEAIPRAGPWLARIPLLGIAALEGLTTFGLVFAASIVIENGKGYFISPYVEGDQLDIHPLLVFVAVLVGATLGGFAGAFIAVPLAAIVDVFVRDVLVPWRRREVSEAATEPPLPPPT